MDALAKHGTKLVVLINTLFGVIGLIFLIGGCFVKLGSDTLDKLAHPLLAQVTSKIPNEVKDRVGIDFDNFSISTFVGGAADAFIAIGIVLLVLVAWAYFGTCCQSRCMLIVYAGILTAVILGEVAVVILFTSNRTLIDNAIKTPLKDSLKFYKGENSTDGMSLGWNALMGLLSCCGVDGSEDFQSATTWENTFTYTDQGVPTTVELEAPVLCCKDKGSQCSVKGSAIAHTYNQGCYAALWKMVEDNKAAAIGVGAGIGVFELILWFLVVWIAKELGKSKSKVGPSNG